MSPTNYPSTSLKTPTFIPSREIHSSSTLSFEKDPIPFNANTPSFNNITTTTPENDIDILEGLRKKYQLNPAIGYLNINSLRRHKFQQLQQFAHISKLDILCIDETELSQEIQTAKFKIVIGDLNIDLSVPNNDKENLLENLCDSYDLTNIMKKKKRAS